MTPLVRKLEPALDEQALHPIDSSTWHTVQPLGTLSLLIRCHVNIQTPDRTTGLAEAHEV